MTHRNEAGTPPFGEDPLALAPPAPAPEDTPLTSGDPETPPPAPAEEDPLTSPSFRLRPPRPAAAPDDAPTPADAPLDCAGALEGPASLDDVVALDGPASSDDAAFDGPAALDDVATSDGSAASDGSESSASAFSDAGEDPLTSPSFRLRPATSGFRADVAGDGAFGDAASGAGEDPLVSPSFRLRPPSPAARESASADEESGEAPSSLPSFSSSAEEDPLTSPSFRLRPTTSGFGEDAVADDGFGDAASDGAEDPLVSPSFGLRPPVDSWDGGADETASDAAEEDPLTSPSFGSRAFPPVSRDGAPVGDEDAPDVEEDPLTSGGFRRSGAPAGEDGRGPGAFRDRRFPGERGGPAAGGGFGLRTPGGIEEDPLTGGNFRRTGFSGPRAGEDPLNSPAFRLGRPSTWGRKDPLTSGELDGFASSPGNGYRGRESEEDLLDEKGLLWVAFSATNEDEPLSEADLTEQGSAEEERDDPLTSGEFGWRMAREASGGDPLPRRRPDPEDDPLTSAEFRVPRSAELEALRAEAAAAAAAEEARAGAQAGAEDGEPGEDAAAVEAAVASEDGEEAAEAKADAASEAGINAALEAKADTASGAKIDAAAEAEAAAGDRIDAVSGAKADKAQKVEADTAPVAETDAGPGTKVGRASKAEANAAPGAKDGKASRAEADTAPEADGVAEADAAAEDGAQDALEIAEVPEVPVAEPVEPDGTEAEERPGDVAFGKRLAALERLVELAEGRLDEELVGEAAALLERAGERMRLSGDHTVVALAGGTGSGKSSLFNAVCGLELSPSGMRRPMTSSAHVCVWGHDGAGPLLDWLEIDKRYRYARAGASAHKGAQEETSLEGLVLIDLPDHDSIQAVHRAEVDRFVGVADLLVWVVDPQKYADAALHRDYIVPFAQHASVTLIVLNQVDRLQPAEIDDCVSDLRRLLESEGLAAPHIITTSAVTEGGVDGLREVLAEAVTAGNARAERLGADLDKVVERFAVLAEGGPVPVEIDEERAEGLVDALTVAAGAPAVAEAMESAYELRAVGYVGWPFARWAAGLRRDPLRAIRLTGLRDELRGAFSGPMGAQQGEVDNALHGITDGVAADVPGPWKRALRTASRSHAAELPDALGESLREILPSFDQVPRWWWLVRIWQLLLVGGAALGVLWSVLVVVYGALDLADPPADLLGDTGILPWVLVLTACLFGMGALTAAACRNMVALSAARHGEKIKSTMREGIARVADEKVLTPVATELSALADFRSAVTTARR